MLQAIIIDDELPAVNSLKMLLNKHVSDINVLAGTTDCKEGIDLIERHKPEVVFLDINMPNMNGFSLLKNLRFKEFDLVFTTAHERYAIQAIRLRPADYLLKPLDVEDLKHAVENIMEMRRPRLSAHDKLLANRRKLSYSGLISLPVKEGIIYQPVAEINYVISEGSYCTFHFGIDKHYLVCKNIGEYEMQLPEQEFFRAHKSNLINIRKVKKYIRSDGHFVEMEDGAVLEISRRKKDEFLHIMRELQQA